MPDLLPLFAGGLVAGTLGGLLGIGGGVVLMPLLRFVVGLSPARAAGTCILAVFFTTSGGAYRHFKLGHLQFKSIIPVIITGAITTAVFSLVFVSLASHDRYLDLGIGLVLSLVSLRMVLEGIPGLIRPRDDEHEGREIKGSLWKKTIIGGSGGILPGLLGIGTGVILVPAFSFILSMPIKTAVASSLASFCANALVSSSFKLAQGFIDLDVALPICVGTLLGSNLGAVLNRHFQSNTVKLMFGLVFCYVSLKFILSFFGVQTT
jgi:uncharacterized membrane protein YfcA